MRLEDIAAFREKLLPDDHVGREFDIVQSDGLQAVVTFRFAGVDLRTIAQLFLNTLEELRVVVLTPVERAEALRHEDDLLVVPLRHLDRVQQTLPAAPAPAGAKSVSAGVEDGVSLPERLVHFRDLAVPLVGLSHESCEPCQGFSEEYGAVQLILEDKACIVIVRKELERVLFGCIRLESEAHDLAVRMGCLERIIQRKKHGLRAFVSHLYACYDELFHGGC